MIPLFKYNYGNKYLNILYSANFFMYISGGRLAFTISGPFKQAFNFFRTNQANK